MTSTATADQELKARHAHCGVASATTPPSRST